MKILVIGDVFGYVGRQMLIKHLQILKKAKEIDLIIANVENTTSGRGLSYSHYKQLNHLGIDVMTSGNHIFDQLETIDFIENVDNLLRPINSNPYHKGPGSLVINKLKKKIV